VGTYYWPGDGTPNSARYYEYVASSGSTWTAAELGARGRTIFGLRGYLARPSTWAENQFIANRVEARNIWIGARRGTSTGTSAARDWFWIADVGGTAGAPSTQENGRRFYQENWSGNYEWADDRNRQSFFLISDGTTAGDANWLDGSTFSNPWAVGEPNGARLNGEWYAATNYDQNNNGVLDTAEKGRWNDFTNDVGIRIDGYLVEYNAHELTGLDQDSVGAVFSTKQAPSQGTGLALVAGDGQIVASWSAPASNGSDITGYLLEYATDSSFTSPVPVSTASLSATVTGLANGVRYFFRVAAINGVGTGAVSSTVSAVPSGTGDTYLAFDGSNDYGF
jgi:hypothetical protein